MGQNATMIQTNALISSCDFARVIVYATENALAARRAAQQAVVTC